MSEDRADPQLELLEKPTTELLDAFGAGNASPGSGSAAALMGLLATKLLITVCDKSLTKDECKPHEVALNYIRNEVAAAEPRLKALFEKDAREFDQVVQLRVARNNAGTPSERAKFSRDSQALLETATDNAFAVIDECMKLIEHGIVVFENGWHAVRGDSGAAISVAVAAVLSGIFIANLNIKTLKGRRYANANLQRCADLYQRVSEKQVRAIGCVTSLNAEAAAAVTGAVQTELEEVEGPVAKK
ncbi:cyclodeaminase/cyclohydrolase family protein [Roseateles amylovorans]|uniref:Cyclodeaminase/cyclohydrolase family protein n=1 Tax=Roseateles amylovorans TaxID=2978473 RepID=A0ABY6AU52_9BURK|nr:cyclodeaminase/cyclohydrolase family protein [Roseateles amylovorans]UXH76202.1 cyclodeaminase/cyclohydrolase family protein [Roseateles amylovorans]